MPTDDNSFRPVLGEAALDSLALAHLRTLDALDGCTAMAEGAEAALRPTACRLRDLHAAHAQRLAETLARHGRVPGKAAVFDASVQRMVTASRAFLDRVDQDAMDQVRRGEEHVLATYRAAEHGVPWPVVKSLVAGMRCELEDLLAETRRS
ncbi:DUF2383 domain-containing protein [Tabrizicola sp.]|uniref:DUF2383 domain-containing protein n=1 Tax=Tabrizicola sp. TaxID=2005166 RepID=UPI0035B2D561